MTKLIEVEHKKDLDLRKTENRKITQMKKVLKENEYILVTTDKTKRIIAISNKEYIEAGLAFLNDKKNLLGRVTQH